MKNNWTFLLMILWKVHFDWIGSKIEDFWLEKMLDFSLIFLFTIFFKNLNFFSFAVIWRNFLSKFFSNLRKLSLWQISPIFFKIARKWKFGKGVFHIMFEFYVFRIFIGMTWIFLKREKKILLCPLKGGFSFFFNNNRRKKSRSFYNSHFGLKQSWKEIQLYSK